LTVKDTAWYYHLIKYEKERYFMQDLLNKIIDMTVSMGGKIICALVIFIVGNFVIKAVLKRMKKSKINQKADATVVSFIQSIFRIALYGMLVVIIISVLGVPMASVITVLAAAGATIGLALQGALSNFAGGIMIMFFKPFKTGDYITTTGGTGTVSAITVFYTILKTVDNQRISVPNGSLMNGAVTNYSSEELRRVDLEFYASFATESEKVKSLLYSAAEGNELVIKDHPEGIFAHVSGYKDNSVKYLLRAWCKSKDYWTVYTGLIEAVNDAFAKEEISAPATNVNITRQ
jgi:small conductance mechanosensitive channel